MRHANDRLREADFKELLLMVSEHCLVELLAARGVDSGPPGARMFDHWAA